MKKIIEITVGMFGESTYFYVGDFDKMKQLMKKRGLIVSCKKMEHADAMTFPVRVRKLDVERMGVWLDKFEIDLLVHEITHVVHDVFLRRGINDIEVFAYYCQYLVKKFLQSYEEFKERF